MRNSLRSLRWIAAISLLLPLQGMAADINLNNITLTDYDKVVKEFSSNFNFSTITPASSLGGLWGFEFGLIGGVTKASELHDIVKRNSPSTSFKDNLYHADLLARIGLPYGFTFEALYFPKRTFSDLKVQHWGVAAMWTPTDAVLEDLPVNIATKLYVTKAELSYGQVINNSTTQFQNVNATITFEDAIYGIQALVSKKFFIFEPYLGLGYGKAQGDLTVNASLSTATIFPGIPNSAGTATTSKPSSAQLFAGLDVKAAFVSLGAEYQRSFGTNRVSGRLSFRF